MITAIGKVSATEKKPTTNDEFMFWLLDNVEIRPFDIVKADNNIGGKKSTTYAIVKDIYHVTDSTGHISNYVSYDFGDVNAPPTTQRLGVVYAEAEVINNNKEVYMPLKDGTQVYFTDETEIKEALGLDKIRNPIPAGFIETTNGVSVPINLNKDFLIGPEGAHLNISGISGLATKTSYAMFLLQAIQQRAQDVAVIILNVKGDDLLRVDEPNPLLKDSEKEKWNKVGLDCKPFNNVTYFFPYKNDSENCYANTALSNEALKARVELGIAYNFIYTYEHDSVNLDLLFSNIDDPNFTMESILNHINDNSDFKDLTWESFKAQLGSYTKAKSGKAPDIPVQSWKKFRRLITKSINNSIFESALSAKKEKRQRFLSDHIQNIQKNTVTVIDVSKLDEQLQCLVFGDVLKTVNDLKMGETTRKEADIPNKIVIFVDELNKYAASTSPKNSPILTNLLEITERGRSEGIILFSAEQFKSAVHDRVKGNCSTHVYGRTNAIEASKPDYRYIPKTFTRMMTRLRKGELILEHTIFGTPIKISFPYPAYYQREDKNE